MPIGREKANLVQYDPLLSPSPNTFAEFNDTLSLSMSRVDGREPK